MSAVIAALAFWATLLLPVLAIWFVALRILPNARALRVLLILGCLLALALCISPILMLWPVAMFVWPAVIALAEMFIVKRPK